MTCEEILATMNEYVDGERGSAICAALEEHLAGCNPCQLVVDNIRQTITLYRDGKPHTMPVKFRRQLHATLKQRWNETHTQKRD